MLAFADVVVSMIFRAANDCSMYVSVEPAASSWPTVDDGSVPSSRQRRFCVSAWMTTCRVPPGGQLSLHVSVSVQPVPLLSLVVETAFDGFEVYTPACSRTSVVMIVPLGAFEIAQLAALEAHLLGSLPADDGIFVTSLDEVGVDFALSVDWRKEAKGWTDTIPWPAAYTPSVAISAATDATTFSVSGGTTAPQIGNTIAVYDETTRTFYRKTILTVTGTGPWALTCDTAANASDTTFTMLATMSFS